MIAELLLASENPGVNIGAWTTIAFLVEIYRTTSLLISSI